MRSDNTGVPHQKSEERLWSAHDVADHFGRSIGWARSRLTRWRELGSVAVCGTDAVTGAKLYSSEQILVAYSAEIVDPAQEA